MDNKEKEKKQIPLRLSSSLWKELSEWAEDDFRSINGVKQRKKGKFIKE